MNLLIESYVRKILCTPLSKHRCAHPSTVPKEPDVNSLPFGSSTSGKTDRTVLMRKIRNLLKVWMSGIRNLLMIKGPTNANFILCFFVGAVWPANAGSHYRECASTCLVGAV